MMKTITPFLWFDDQAEDAVNFYISVFKNSKILNIAYYSERSNSPSGRPRGSVMTVSFEINNQPFIALNGSTHFKIGPAISFVIPCESQEEIDYYWTKLSAIPEDEKCGWLTDKFGVSWQVIPHNMDKLMTDSDPDKRERTMQAILQMKKIEIEKLTA